MQSGYAFLHFASTPEGLRSAITAVEQTHHLVVDNITYQCKVTHSLQTQLMSMKKNEELQQQEKKYLPPSLTHSFENPFDDSSFHTYNSIPNISTRLKPHSRAFKNNSLNYECHEKDFSSYRMNNLNERMVRRNQSSEVLWPRLTPSSSLENHEPSLSPFSQSLKKTYNHQINLNDDNTDINFSFNDGYTTISQDFLNHHPGRHFSSSLSSPLMNSIYEF